MIENYLAYKLFFSQVDDCFSNIKYGFLIDMNLVLFYFMLSSNSMSIFSCLTDPTSSSSGHGKSGLMCWTFPNGPLSVYLFRRFSKEKYACLTGIKLSR